MYEEISIFLSAAYMVTLYTHASGINILHVKFTKEGLFARQNRLRPRIIVYVSCQKHEHLQSGKIWNL